MMYFKITFTHIPNIKTNNKGTKNLYFEKNDTTFSYTSIDIFIKLYFSNQGIVMGYFCTYLAQCGEISSLQYEAHN